MGVLLGSSISTRWVKRPLIALLLLLPLVEACKEKGGGKEEETSVALDTLSLRRIADSISGHWKPAQRGNEALRFRFSGSVRGSKNPYSFKGDKKTNTRGHLTPVRLERIDGKVAIRSLRYVRDTSFIRSLGPDRLTLESDRKEQLYIRHEGVGY